MACRLSVMQVLGPVQHLSEHATGADPQLIGLDCGGLAQLWAAGDHFRRHPRAGETAGSERKRTPRLVSVPAT